MAKKKTRVLLPGGIQGLVKGLQNGTSEYAPQPLVDEDEVLTGADERDEEASNEALGEEIPAARASVESADNQDNKEVKAEEKRYESIATATNTEHDGSSVAAEPAADDNAGSAQARGRKPKENTIKEYRIVKDDSADSWDLFIDMAKQYKQGGGKLATIYIDETLKSVLDRMKYAGPDKLSTSAILSSIVARFVYDHEDEIKKALFSGNLL